MADAGVGVRGLRYLLLTALLVALLFSSASIPSYGARLPQSDSLSIVDWYWGRPGTKVDAGPGDERMPLTVVLVNTRKEVVFGVAAELRTSGPFRPHGGGGAVAYSAGPARSGDAVFLTFELDVSPDASPGSYGLEVYVRYNYVDSKGDCEERRRCLSDIRARRLPRCLTWLLRARGLREVQLRRQQGRTELGHFPRLD
ncbi:MAG: hypothetical protein ACO2O1_09770 [Candidatus Caldarchaeales archaeon]